MTKQIEKILTLRTVGILNGTADETLAEIAAVLEELDLAAGQPLFAKGDYPGALYIVAHGRLRVHDGALLIEELGAGQLVGEMALLAAAPCSVSATACEDSRLYRLDQETLFELLTDHCDILRNLLGLLSARLRARARELGALQHHEALP